MSVKNFKEVAVGDKFFMTSFDGRSHKKVGDREVTKVGRKFFYMKPYQKELKFDIETGAYVGPSASYAIHESEDIFDEGRKRRAIVEKVRKSLYRNLNVLTYEQAVIIGEALGVNMNIEEI